MRTILILSALLLCAPEAHAGCSGAGCSAAGRGVRSFRIEAAPVYQVQPAVVVQQQTTWTAETRVTAAPAYGYGTTRREVVRTRRMLRRW